MVFVFTKIIDGFFISILFARSLKIIYSSSFKNGIHLIEIIVRFFATVIFVKVIIILIQESVYVGYQILIFLCLTVNLFKLFVIVFLSAFMLSF